MKKLSVCLFITFAFVLACSSVSVQQSPAAAWEASESLRYVPVVPDVDNSIEQQAFSGKTAFEYFRDERLRCGWNLGNSLDAHSNGWAEERRWGNPMINQEIINGVKAAGFDVIRIPVTWTGHIGEAPDHHVEEERLARVAEVVDMARKAGLKVIINLHHDGSSESASRESGWLSIKKASQSRLYAMNNDYQTITHQFVRVWVQVANYFKNYGDWLFFESMNEIHDGGWGFGVYFKADPSFQFDILNEWNQLFTDAVRASGGNNIHRYLVIPSYCAIPECTYPGGSIINSAANVGDFFKLPNDSAPHKQIVTFHYYKPDDVGLGHNGGRSNWGSDEDKKRTDEDFAPFKGAYIEHNIPVIIGECGAIRQVYPDDPAKEAQARESRRSYITHVFATAKKYGLVPVYWDNGVNGGSGERFGLFDRATGQINSDESRLLIQSMVNAAR